MIVTVRTVRTLFCVPTPPPWRRRAGYGCGQSMTGAMRRCSDMNATDILNAVQQAGAALRVEGDSLVASNASRLAPELKAAIRQNKPQLITALARPVCAVCGATGHLGHEPEQLLAQDT